jgi:hypothetical protein
VLGGEKHLARSAQSNAQAKDQEQAAPTGKAAEKAPDDVGVPVLLAAVPDFQDLTPLTAMLSRRAGALAPALIALTPKR